MSFKSEFRDVNSQLRATSDISSHFCEIVNVASHELVVVKNKDAILRNKVRIARYKLAVVRKKSQNCDFISCNSDFITDSCEFISWNSAKSTPLLTKPHSYSVTVFICRFFWLL